MNVLIQTMLIYFGVFILSFIFFNFMSKNYLMAFIRVKAARGKKVLVNVKPSVGAFYPVIGTLEGDFIIFKDREAKAGKQKTPKRLPVATGDFTLLYGCWCINVDEAANCVYKPTGEIVNADIIKFNNLYERCLYKPSPEAQDKVFLIIIMIIAIISLFLGVAVFVKLGNIEKAIALLGQVGQVAGANVL